MVRRCREERPGIPGPLALRCGAAGCRTARAQKRTHGLFDAFLDVSTGPDPRRNAAIHRRGRCRPDRCKLRNATGETVRDSRTTIVDLHTSDSAGAEPATPPGGHRYRTLEVPGEASRHPAPCAVRRGTPQLSSAARAYGRGNSGGLDRPLLKGPTGNQQQSLALDAPHSLRARSNNYRLVFLEAVVRVPRRRRLTCPGVIPGHFGRLTAQFRSSPSPDTAPPGTDPSSASLAAHPHPPGPARA